MSNSEINPQEQICVEDPNEASNSVLIIEPRDVPLGGVRAMNVRRTIPQRARTLIGAWCFLDHYGPDNVTNSGGMNVAAHPHIGLQTVSWLFSGEIEHRDSAGFHALVKPGELNLMTAGSGISHSERSTKNTTVLHGAQLWVALPKHARGVEKTFAHYEPQIISGAGWQAQVFLGSLLGDTSPVKTYTPLLGAEIRLEAGTELLLDSASSFEAEFEHGVLVDSGEVEVAVNGDAKNPTSVQKDDLAFINSGARSLTITAGGEGARILLIGGTPFGEQIVMWWNFIGTDHDEIAQARSDWQAELNGVGVGDPSDPDVASRSDVPEGKNGRYGLPQGEPEPPLPAPKLPLVKLMPRGEAKPAD
ncbi:MAG TPA: pirin family protein [Microbacteriaceae bacterium]|nr:pirin family protein [Microbacteriaceae bacterium]